MQGDCLDLLRGLPDGCVDAVVTDPPYELSNDGKASACRVLLEFLFPKNPKVKAKSSSECHLSFLISQIAELSGFSLNETPSSTVPEITVALDDDVTGRDIEVENGGESTVRGTECEGGDNNETQAPESLDNFFLELADTTAFLNALHGIGCSFYAGRIGVGLGIPPASLPRLLSQCLVVNDSHQIVGFDDLAFSDFISTCKGTTCRPMLRFDLAGRSVEGLSANTALFFFAIALQCGAKLIRTDATTGSLPPVLEPVPIRIVNRSADRALSFNLIVHKQSVSSAGFMGKAWDGSKVAFDVAIWREVLRVLKPGGHMLSFFGTRTYHRGVVSIEDAGFEIRDCIAWMYGAGFPKSHNLSGEWDGWGSALKPAFEPVVVARKPFKGTLAENVATHGTGALNIDACRVGIDGGTAKGSKPTGQGKGIYGAGLHGDCEIVELGKGRWPANVAHDGSDEVEEAFARFGESKSTGGQSSVAKGFGEFGGGTRVSEKRDPGFGDTGTASRFFFCGKASKQDRDEGLDALSIKQSVGGGGGIGDYLTDVNSASGKYGSEKAPARNHHPTVKPTALMRWLCRMITPPGGIVLDPFTGSGSTGKAAMLEGFRFLGFELDRDENGNPLGYIDIARRRIAEAAAQESLPLFDTPQAPIPKDAGQLSLLEVG